MGMGSRLLICTQAVDTKDQALGFFHEWIGALAREFTSLHVICLKEGAHTLPGNVTIHSLGKEKGVSRLGYVVRFYRYLIVYWGEYDTVFVHMNQEYVLLAGLLWGIGGKRVVLWRNHKKGSVFTRVASLLAHTVCYTSSESYVAKYPNALQMPIGIDTKLFAPSSTVSQDSILFLGRLDPVKNPDTFLAAVQLLRREGVSAPVRIVGEPTTGRETYAEEVRKKYEQISDVSFTPAVPHAQTPGIYASHSVYVNLTPSGSFDKTIGEAMASGCMVVVANQALRGILSEDFIVDPGKPESVARGIRIALTLSKEESEKVRKHNREWIEKEHSLEILMKKITAVLA